MNPDIPTPRTMRHEFADPELAAIDAMLQIFAGLSPQTAARILDYLNDRVCEDALAELDSVTERNGKGA